ncbi:MAG: hypothetical protein UHI81_09455 [Olegusella sp.]|nr:hypothetical protein [Olegusella sp.]
MTLQDFFHLIKRHLVFVVGLSLALAVAGGAYSILHAGGGISANVGSSDSIMLYVQPRVVLDEDGNIRSSATTDNNILTANVIAFVTSDACENEAAKSLHLEDLSAYSIEATSEDARLINVSVTDNDPEDKAEAYEVANALGSSIQDVAKEIADIQSITVVNSAKAPEELSQETGDEAVSPKHVTKYALVGLVGGLLVAITLVILMDAMDTRVRGEEELEELTDVPVFAVLPHDPMARG